ncbi:hypothetical protein RN001_014994 [Aquatica leii]|uniref:Protein-lysine N-methyltransferase SMYD4 n=1 Tax=Aquatica leii TaxID=1421715 RepID=A0AAN7NV58_9COLE|nr:hypothetical protein RN001_014994 [Aquatica leii]
MDNLFKHYSRQVRCSDTEVNKEFLKIYKHDKHIEDWLTTLTSKLDLKDDAKANTLRCQANQLYKSKRFKDSFEIYTKAMCIASIDGNEIGLIVANRSALFYMMDYFEDSLKDIEFSLQCYCPDDVKLKLYIRRIKCYAKMNVKDKLKEALDFLENSHLIVTDEKKTEILSFVEIKKTDSIREVNEELPLLTAGPNPKFLYASSVIRLSFDKLRGRHVIANIDIKPGDVLFVEKPFVFAPVFVNDNIEMSSTKCYNCLKTIYSSIPCSFCVKTIYCDINCRKKCWEEFHRWECFGMRCNLWYYIGIGFPALRTIIKGVSTGLCTLETKFEDDTARFGVVDNNYPYFNKLVSNLSKMENVLPLIISAGVVVLFLETYTDFFDWLNEQSPDCYTKAGLIELIGGQITKHIAQLQCNSSVIHHISNRTLDDGGSVACAIYPSISMMNHSCSANVKISYIREVAVVRASEKISKGEEVFNCYGIDYRYADRQTRQDRCSQYYHFTCDCKICQRPELEMFVLDE